MILLKDLLVPILFIAYLIFSIVMFAKRNKFIAKYDLGYVSSFLFTAYMLMPVALGVSALVSPESLSNMEAPIGVFFIYPAIGLAIFLYINRGMTTSYKLGKLFAMIGLGIAAGYVLIFKMLRIIHFFESDASTSSNRAHKSNPIPRVNSKGGEFRARINEYGEIYHGTDLIARINDNGDIYYPNGEYYAHMDDYGDVYDASGKYLGRIKNGEIQGSDWSYTGRLNKD